MRSVKALVFLLGVFLSIFLVSAIQEAQPQPFKYGECRDLIQTSSVCSEVILESIANPDGTIIYVNSPMNKTGSTFTYNYCANHGIGEGFFVTSCPELNVSAPVSFTVTTTGNNSVFSLAVIIFLLVLAIIFMLVALLFREEFFTFISGCLYLMAGIFTQIFGLGYVSDIYTRAISYVCIGLGILFTIGAYLTYNSNKTEEED